MKRDKQAAEVVLVGTVTGNELDDDDNIVSVDILTDDDTYSVEPTELGEQLLDYIDEEIEVTGSVTEEDDGTRRITVISYEVLSEENPIEDDFYGYDVEDEEDIFDDEQDRFSL